MSQSPPERTMMFVYNPSLAARLVGLGNFRGKEWMLSAGTFSIGRDGSNDLVLDKEPGVSKTHCKLTLENNQYIVTDAESRNGTLVNGMAVKRAILQDKDEIRICNAMFRFEQSAGAGARPDAVTTAQGKPLESPPQTDLTPRSSKRGAPEPPPPIHKSATVWPYFLIGMILFFGMAGGTLYLLGLIPPDLIALVTGATGTPPPREPQEVTPEAPVAEAPKPVVKEPKEAKEPIPAAPPPAKEPEPVETAPPVAEATPPPAEEPPRPVEPPPPEKKREDLVKTDENTFTGNVKLVVPPNAKVERADVKHSSTGRVTSVSVKAGQRVSKGDPLLSYEDVDFRRRLETAREQYRSLREIAEAQDTDRARKALAEAKSDLARMENQASALKLTSPVDGTVDSVAAQAGKRATKNSKAVVITVAPKGGKTTVVGIIPPSALKKVPNGMKVTVLIGDATHDATVTDSFSVPAGHKTTMELIKPPAGLTENQSVKFKVRR